MRQLVRDEPAPGFGRRVVFAPAKRDVVADRKSARAQHLRLLIGRAVVMDADGTKILPKARLEKGPRRGVKELPGACCEADLFEAGTPIAGAQTDGFAAPGVGVAPASWAIAAKARAEARARHDALGGPVGRALCGIVGPADFELRLDFARPQQCQDGLITDRAWKLENRVTRGASREHRR